MIFSTTVHFPSWYNSYLSTKQKRFSLPMLVNELRTQERSLKASYLLPKTMAAAARKNTDAKKTQTHTRHSSGFRKPYLVQIRSSRVLRP